MKIPYTGAHMDSSNWTLGYLKKEEEEDGAKREINKGKKQKELEGWVQNRHY